MITVHFIGTSVLLNILEIPGRSQSRKRILQEMKDFTEAGDKFILPLATIIETGNHIAHINEGNMRRDCAERLSITIKKVLSDTLPWAYNKGEISDDDLWKIAEGFPHYAQQQNMGLGDLSILTEYLRYKNKHKRHFRVKLWSLDEHLCAFDGVDSI